MSNLQKIIATKIDKQLKPVHLAIENESSRHRVPTGSESHFKVTVVTTKFTPLSQLERHQHIHQILADELTQLHALSIHAYTPKEWVKRNKQVHRSPPCRGSMKKV